MFENLHVPKGSYSGRNTETIKSDEIQAALSLIARWVKKLNCFHYKEDELLNFLIETIDRNERGYQLQNYLIHALYDHTKKTFYRWYMNGNHCGARTQEILNAYYGK